MTLTLDLSGHRALVTGAGQGVGRGIATYLARGGASVLINDIDAERAEQTAAELRADGDCRPLAFDVTDHDAVVAAVRAAGPVDIVVNNAGNAGAGSGFGMEPFVQTTPPEWTRFLRVNLDGVMNVVHACLPGMIESGWGRIVTIVSDAGRVGEPNMAAYAAAKAGAAGFSRAIAREVARSGITVNNVALGSMRPPGSPEPRPEHVRRYLVRRLGDPADAAGMVAYLVSPWASWVTAQTFAVNGGYSVTL